MKRILLSIALLTAVFSFSSCKKESPSNCKTIKNIYPVYMQSCYVCGSELNQYQLVFTDDTNTFVSITDVVNYKQGGKYCK